VYLVIAQQAPYVRMAKEPTKGGKGTHLSPAMKATITCIAK